MEALETAINILSKAIPTLQGIYLFGSTDTEFETATSDLDIAILNTAPLESVQRWKVSEEIARKINRDVDLVDLLQASTVFKFQIITTGKRIFCQDEKTCAWFETMAISKYIRFNEARQGILLDIEKRGKIRNG